jgi:hypothetical protein
MSDDEYNQRAHARMQQELAELENSRARYQAQFGQVVARAALGSASGTSLPATT